MANNNAALYMRLSRDDESYGDSVSIETQRTLLRSYAKEHSLNVVDEYIDDGWSGTNFDRPSFQRMMRDVENGIVNCIVTKDLSRFGREHVMMGYYLDFLFPRKACALHRYRGGGGYGKGSFRFRAIQKTCSTNGTRRTPAAR